MKTFSILPAVMMSAAFFAAPVRADDPAPIKLAPEVRALLNDLLKQADAEPKETKPEAPADPPATPAAGTTAPKAPTAAATAPKATPTFTPTPLQTNTLQTSSLMPSAPLGGRGTNGGTPRLNLADWRLLFPLKDQK